MIGPKVGPFRGPMDHMEKARARYSSVTISLTDPGALAIIADPAKAPKKRTTKTSGRDVARPHGIMRSMKRSMLTMYTGLRPYISEMGAKITDPAARPITASSQLVN